MMDGATQSFGITMSGQIHLGNGIWLEPVDQNLTILSLTTQAGTSAAFAVTARFKIPQEGSSDHTIFIY